jgi:hypothetical protein
MLMGSGCVDPGWTSEPIWTIWRRENSWPNRDLNSDPSAIMQIVARQRQQFDYNSVFYVVLAEELSWKQLGLPSCVIPCGGGVEYLHRSPASCRRRTQGKSRIWGSRIWSRVPRDSDPIMTALARTRSSFKRQTRSLVRESAPHQQTRNCLTVIKIWL